jgi:hypothetical protein
MSIISNKDFIRINSYGSAIIDFIQDCQTLEIPFLPVQTFDRLQYGVEPNHVIVKDSQLPIPENLMSWCEKLLEKEQDFLNAQAEREKPKEPTFEEEKTETLSKISLMCSEARRKVSQTTDANKTATWAVYRELSEKYRSGSLTQDEIEALELEILYRNLNEDLETFIEKIESNSKIFMKASAMITGLEKRANLDVGISTTKEQLQDILSALQQSLNSMET